MPYADNAGIRIHYLTEGEGPPLMLHHWSFATLESWYDYGYVAALKNDYRLILLDARGHGASDKPHDPEAYGLKARVDDVVAVLDHLDLAQVNFFGYSMGGWVGFGAAQYAPERFRSLIIAGSHPYAQDVSRLRRLARCGIEEGPEAFLAMWGEQFGKVPPAQRARVPAYDFEALHAVARDRPNLEAVLPTMTMPCLLIAGEDDPVYPEAKRCVASMPNVTFVALPGLDHRGTIEHSDLVVSHVTRFLADVGSMTREV